MKDGLLMALKEIVTNGNFVITTILAKHLAMISNTQYEIHPTTAPMQRCLVAVFMYSPNDASGYQLFLGWGGGRAAKSSQ